MLLRPEPLDVLRTGPVKGLIPDFSLSEAGIWPAFVTGVTFPESWTLFLFAQGRPQSAANESIQPREPPAASVLESVLEVAIPASDHRGEVGNDPRQTVASGATCLFPYLVLEPLQALFPHPALARFEPVAEKLEALPFYSAQYQRIRCVSGFAFSWPTRRRSPPNRVRLLRTASSPPVALHPVSR